MAEVITMPRLSDTMEEGKVAKWHKNVGDAVKEGEILAEIETDKAVQDFESEIDGILLYQGVEEGGASPVDSVLAIIGKEGEDISSLINNESGNSEKPAETKVATTTKIVAKQPEKQVAVIDRSSEIEHKVEPKETLYSLSKKYGVSADEIKLSNEQIAVSGLQIGMIVKIPGTKKISSNESSIGSTKTPVAEVSKPQEKEVVSQNQTITHVVEPKETLYSLSKKYGVTVDELIKQNQALLVNGLKIGQTLTISKK